MNIGNALKESGLSLLEAEVLLAEVLQKDRTYILAHLDGTLSEKDMCSFNSYTKRRKNNEPIAYILGEKDFYGRKFFVSPDVLVPRPATEGLVDAVLDFISEKKEGVSEIDTDIVSWVHAFSKGEEPRLIVDIGTGSGCIAITIALETSYNFIATDISSAALVIAKKNALRHNVLAGNTFKNGNLLKPLSHLTEPFILVSNPPYIPEKEILMPDVANFEPQNALYAGPEGITVLHSLVKEASKNQYCTAIAVECRSFQAEKLRKIL